MPTIWTEATLQRYIDDGDEEGHHLEYKAAAALGKNNDKKAEITKDVSAFANADGGTIIYGIAEDNQNRHLPGRLDPVDSREFSKEWLQQVINNITPVIPVNIVAVPLPSFGSDEVAYVIEVPKGETAHQALDRKYYRRYNSIVQPMIDGEIRDVMGRIKHPKITCRFWVESVRVEGRDLHIIGVEPTVTRIKNVLVIEAKNDGPVFAQFVTAFFSIHPALVHENEKAIVGRFIEDGFRYCTIRRDNTVRDFLGMSGLVENHGPPRSVPLLPGLTHRWEIELYDQYHAEDFYLPDEPPRIKWSVHTDNAPPISGSLPVTDVRIRWL
jgi:hypothetical protein